jgi:cytochrome bd-type quinol oxidase subunit 2
MTYITLVANLLCGLLVLVAGIIYFRNTIIWTKSNKNATTDVKDLLKEFEVGDFMKLLLIAFVFITLIGFINNTDMSFIPNVFFPAVVIAAGVESFSYILKRKRSHSSAYKIVALIALSLVNGISI